MEKKDLEDMFNPYGKIVGVSMFRGFGFVQFERVEEAEAAKAAQKGRIYKGYKIGPRIAVMGTARRPGLGPVHPCMGVMGGATDVMDVTDVSPGTTMTGGAQAESLGQVATLVIPITVTVVQRAETRTSEVTHGILLTAEKTMIDTTAVEVVQKTFTGGRMNPTGTRTEIHGTDGVSQKLSCGDVGL
eukprot:superscaffoldBa00009579_g24174